MSKLFGDFRDKIKSWADRWRGREPKELRVHPVKPADAVRERYSRSCTKKGPGRRHQYGKGGGAKLRKRVKARPLCPTDHSLDPCWHLSNMARAERERANALSTRKAGF